jgi:hypothetical protein
MYFSDIFLALMGAAAIFGPGLALLGLLLYLYRQARVAVFDWATAHQYTIVRCHYRTFRRGPFFTLGGHTRAPVYYIVVVDQAGQTRAGWARYGPEKTVEVRWDVRPPA